MATPAKSKNRLRTPLIFSSFQRPKSAQQNIKPTTRNKMFHSHQLYIRVWIVLVSLLAASSNAFPVRALPVKVGVHTKSPYNACASSSNTLHLEELQQDFRSFGHSSYIDRMGQTPGPISRASWALVDTVQSNREKIAKMGVAFGLSYSIISQINGSVSLSLAWYISSKNVSASRVTT